MLTILLCLVLFCSQLNIVNCVCTALNNCNGHGKCNYATNICECYVGWGASTDITTYRSPDCSQQVCPSGKSWGDIPQSASKAHHIMECSNKGICDRGTGLCTCLSGYGGPACNRNLCPNDCSGHGMCISMRDMAKLSRALPLNANTIYGYDKYETVWDADAVHGCVCDSSWDVGLASGETQTPEYFGADCSLRHCQTGDDPRTTADETDCYNVTATGSTSVGATGNICHVDCANRGICDYNSGTCTCFHGYNGANCGNIME